MNLDIISKTANARNVMTVVTHALMGILALCVILHVPHVRPKTVQGSTPLSSARPATAVQN